jgi:uncharacterized protein YegP (UPF0339 family)
VKGKFCWRFKAGKDEIVAVRKGSETKQGCLTGINSIISKAIFAAVKEQTTNVWKSLYSSFLKKPLI